ncbi:hypothetical protein Hanom_Chr08g00683351 [Helianthus anomalus]
MKSNSQSWILLPVKKLLLKSTVDGKIQDAVNPTGEATTTQVLPTIIFSNASCTSFSDTLSSALVASSKRRIAGFLSIALASAILCFWPPDSWAPLSPQPAMMTQIAETKTGPPVSPFWVTR